MTLQGNNPLTADGEYTILDLLPGQAYLVAINGDFGGGTLTLNYTDPITQDSRSMSGGSWTAADEFSLVCVSDEIKFTLAGSTSPEISISIVKLP